MPRVVVSQASLVRALVGSSFIGKVDYGMAALMSLGGRGTGERTRRSTVSAPRMDPTPKKRVSGSAAWREARELVWAHRRRLAIGLLLMLVSRATSLVLPT